MPAPGLYAGGANAALDALLAAFPWVQWHTADPGAAGTTAVAVEADRVQVEMGAASGGSSTNTNEETWAAVAGSEDYTHATFWSLATGGAVGLAGTVTAPPVVAGDTARLAPGSVTVSFPLIT